MTHWTDEQITHWLYGLEPEAAHLEECSDCRGRAENAAARKSAATTKPEVSWEFLAEQRRSINRRMERPLYDWPRIRAFASVVMLLLVAVLSFNLLRPPAATVPLATPADERLFSDLVAIDQSTEPRAVKPIRSLFEE